MIKFQHMMYNNVQDMLKFKYHGIEINKERENHGVDSFFWGVSLTLKNAIKIFYTPMSSPTYQYSLP